MNYPSEIPSGSYIDNGRYKVVKTLGQGGFGRTYLVKDKRYFNEYRVLKEFVPQVSDPGAVAKSRELFGREAKVLNHLKHEQIPEFYGWFEEDNRLFLVQQFVDGKTYADLLHERLIEDRAFSEAEVTQILKDILPVLQYIHTNHIIHRDISPDNIMLCKKVAKPILIDFGVVNQKTATEVASGAFTAGTTVGKQSYSPVEQIGRGICFPCSDLYALGVTAMVLLTGKQPRDFYDASDEKLQWRRYTQVSDKLAEVIDKMSAESHRDRYQSAQEVLADLFDGVPETFITPDSPVPGTFIPPKPTELEPQPKSKNPLILGGVGAAAILGGLFFFLTPNLEGVCNTLNNCSSNLQYKAEYESIADRAEPILAEAANDDNLKTYDWQQLQTLKSKLQTVSRDLEAIPVSAKIYEEVEQTLADVQTQLERVEIATTPELPDNMFVNPDVNN